MLLLERQSFVDELAQRRKQAAGGAGQAVFVCGEAGIGKTALVSAFLAETQADATVVRAYCDPLTTPHALGPVFEIWSQLCREDAAELSRERLFGALFAQLQQSGAPCIVLIEDLHWADEATLDFVRYLSRRLAHWRILLIGTFRDDEAGPAHPLTRAIGDLTGAHVSRIKLAPLSLQAVNQLASTVGKDGARVYEITGGNAFFVRELLSAPPGSVPATVRDSMSARLARCSSEARHISEYVALTPGRMESDLLTQLLGPSQAAVDECVERGILTHDRGALSFRHELARRAVEDTVAPARARQRHAEIMSVLIERGADIARVVHHALGARDENALLRYAPEAGRRAATVGAHREAAAFFAAALEFVVRLPTRERVDLYERHAYECYLTSQIRAAVDSSFKALALWGELQEARAEGRTLRFLSRLHWFLGDRASATKFALQAIELHERFPPDRDLAMAYSNRAQLAMLSGRENEAIDFGSRAVQIARKLGDVEIESHALNNMGTARLGVDDETGRPELERALALALEHDLHEHAARAYVNLATSAVRSQTVERAERYLRDGLAYCDERDLDSWTHYLQSYQARFDLDRGQWVQAGQLATLLVNSAGSNTISRIPGLVVLAQVRMRRGEPGVAELLDDALAAALPTEELQRIGRVAAARAEYAWLRGDLTACARETQVGLDAAKGHDDRWLVGELLFWKSRAAPGIDAPLGTPPAYEAAIRGDWRRSAEEFARLRMPFEQAMMLLHGDATALTQAQLIIEQLGAEPLRARLADAQRSIQRTARGTNNPHGLTNRELEILRLLATGCTNAELAQKLFVSTKTVDHHVSAVLGKLQVRSRAQAVTVAHELGLMG